MSSNGDGWWLMYWKSSNSDESTVAKELSKELKGNKPALKKFRALVRLLNENGPTLPEPHNKQLDNVLYELRDLRNGKRYYYVETDFILKEDGKKKRIILLLANCGDKGSQERDIKTAISRVKNGCELDNILNKEKLTIKKDK